jgi:hypothetical protein
MASQYLSLENDALLTPQRQSRDEARIKNDESLFPSPSRRMAGFNDIMPQAGYKEKTHPLPEHLPTLTIAISIANTLPITITDLKQTSYYLQNALPHHPRRPC